MKKDLKNESGMTLIESMFAMIIMLIGLLTMAQVLAFCVIAGKTYGRDAGQTTAAARDKMEELTALQFTWNAKTSTETVAPGLAAGGSLYPDAPQQLYADLVDSYGYTSPYDPVAPSNDSTTFTRQWKIENDATGTIKKIIVSVRSNKSFSYGVTPSTSVVTNKTRETE
jgi:hypothetical protein